MPRVERDEHGRDVLDQQCDADLEPLDRDEVNQATNAKGGDPEDGEKRRLAGVPRGRAPRQTSRTAKRRRNAPVARTSVSRSRDDASRLEDDLRDAPLSAQSVAAVSTIAYPSAGGGSRAALSGRRLYTGTAGTWRSLSSAPALEREAASSNPAVPTSPFRPAPRRRRRKTASATASFSDAVLAANHRAVLPLRLCNPVRRSPLAIRSIVVLRRAGSTASATAPPAWAPRAYAQACRRAGSRRDIGPLRRGRSFPTGPCSSASPRRVS